MPRDLEIILQMERFGERKGRKREMKGFAFNKVWKKKLGCQWGKKRIE
jgi:hypothetical protein